jgi:hypothetical protein
MARTYTYIDGESHYIRSQEAWRSLHGKDASLERLRVGHQQQDWIVLTIPKAKVFWTRHMPYGGVRIVYFTSVVADESSLFDINVALRGTGIEPFVIQERKQLAQQRQNTLETTQVIEKAKGVDAALSVRVLEDAYNDNFDDCAIFTSDVDYLPVIEAVLRRGKRVFVAGYKSGLSERSPLMYVPDQFLDLKTILSDDCILMPQGSNAGGS